MGKPIQVKTVLATAYRTPKSSSRLEDSLSRQLALIETVTEWFRMLTLAPASAVLGGPSPEAAAEADGGEAPAIPTGEDDDDRG